MRADIDDLDKDGSPPGVHRVEDAQTWRVAHSRYQNPLSGKEATTSLRSVSVEISQP
jgi:hypothetical protein